MYVVGGSVCCGSGGKRHGPLWRRVAISRSRWSIFLTDCGELVLDPRERLHLLVKPRDLLPEGIRLLCGEIVDAAGPKRVDGGLGYKLVLLLRDNSL